MMVVMTPEATQAQIDAVVAKLEARGVHAKVMPGELTTAIGAIGDPEGVRELGLEGLAGVDQVIPISRPYKLASREFSVDRTVVRVGGDLGADTEARFGGEAVSVIAGPCSVESPEMMRDIARLVRGSGAVALRGGAFKPRTSPYAFQGLGRAGLEILAEVRAESGLPVVTEVLDVRHIDMIVEHADMMQVGARNMQNFALLDELGKAGRPVLHKRGLSATVEELLMAAEYVMANGNRDVILCERGIRTYERATRNTLDVSAIPVLQRETHLPVIVDPSHAGGTADLVGPLAFAAIAAGADGLIVEVHPEPDAAICDGPQQLRNDAFADYAARVEQAAAVAGKALHATV